MQKKQSGVSTEVTNTKPNTKQLFDPEKSFTHQICFELFITPRIILRCGSMQA